MWIFYINDINFNFLALHIILLKLNFHIKLLYIDKYVNDNEEKLKWMNE